MSLRLVPETMEKISRAGEVMGINNPTLMCRIYLEAMVRIIEDYDDEEPLPPIVVASKAVYKSLSANRR